ncbi:methyl-accepting chemotaxis protein [Aquisalinus flavus]|uniref:Methyl-accepting chemotaxis protein n=1 Tax=Aquisalinus flavus TaxID=1526572 RepID=A0A8J2V6V7_9PROT|nr:polyhydroxyalkanoate synthesis repressor PhaR [Aquisalinus flavus]MBD0428067.1 polyhydroxyalkanoate synthesis repressor PhaR [Aquisalinus flavus]GGD18908.1 methyl-accepting chemotaxis protein [Aquisalinus flavus]
MTSQEKKQKDASQDGPIIIKKYANRRLYNTATSSYVTLDYLSGMVREGEEFVVYDAKSGDEITRSVLTQIIFEEENKGQNLLPISFLRQLIGYYGDSMQSFVPSYLEMSMESFHKNQEAMRKSMSEAFGDSPGLKLFEDVTRQNMAMFERGMKMFGITGAMPASPWGTPADDRAQTDAGASEAVEKGKAEAEAEIAELKRELAQLRDQLKKD